MGFAAAGALVLSNQLFPRAGSRLSSSSGLLLLYLSTSSLLAAASTPRLYNTQASKSFLSLPTCSVNNNTCPISPYGLRLFHPTPQACGSNPHYSYRIAASYSAKGHRLHPGRDLFTHNGLEQCKSTITDIKECKLHKDKRTRPRSGQDAFFVSQVGDSDTIAFGVADGVGGWSESGVDPADFAHGLCEYMACAARMFPEGSKAGPLHPKDLLQIGYKEVMQDKSIIGGGSTACIALAEPDGLVEVANLGDSGFMHLGLNAVRHFSHPQTHAFNTPYQLSKTPERMLVQMAVFGGTSALADLPNDANVTNHRVRHGDVLVFATDGVWDNLSPQDALGIVSRSMLDLGAWVENDAGFEVSEDLQSLVQGGSKGNSDADSLQAKLALAITKEAKDTSLNTKRDGPFAKEVQRYYPDENWHGGKPDDIVAVVVVVVESPVD
ncbi:5-azacytidine resistance protein azr1 [Lepidopterella palustris CBS 459.81]|uniref:Protein phosphatase n=1 Tax=Lepidopterella palustris CBS 459.81 TaxID=1314670 RepID=A0A8E2E5T4_9PEZI|nr:5-azacytidine resistance protein azr1 [Lepidopterella palustris CBS 459.81]